VAAGAHTTAVLLAVALGCWLGGLATRPLHALLTAVDRIAAGDLSVPPGLAGRDEAGQLGARLDLLVHDIRETQRLAVTDALTGLGNVRQLTEAVRLEVERAARFGRTLGVLLLDLDHFKQVNDAYGHRAGDTVLTELARRIRGVVREVDLAFRRGGEEFVVLLPETGVAGSLTAARRIGDAVRDEPFPVTQRRADGDTFVNIAVTVSIGVAVFPGHGATAADALESADAALYAAKAAGRDTFVLADGGPVAAIQPGGLSVAAPRSPSGASARASGTRSAPDR
jgi:diguanylate cyclase (GGDEF)-like protein